MRNQEINIIINSSNICIHNGHECAYNGKSECLNCSVLTGSSKCSIKFTPARIDQEINKIIIQLPPRPEEVKAPQSEDDLDEGTFVYFLSGAIHHLHSGNIREHIHYPINEGNIHIGNFCLICGCPVVGRNFCGYCDSMLFDSERCFVTVDGIHLSEAVLKAS